MIKTERLLKVPSDIKIRNLLRKEACELVVEKELQPPADFELLENLARELLQRLDLENEYLDFTIVLCGNEIWRKVIAATPFDRRLLLLPQCLKNTQSCKADVDSLGLICAGCKGCGIDDVLTKAEALGYTTLVAEGTTVAVGLVEEGAIDAVIGVSCMPVLQRSFEPVSRAAVPVMGLPLLYNGCENTNVDYSWLLNEMNQFEENADIQPLSVSLLKNQVQDYFTEFHLKPFFQFHDETEKLAKQMLMMGGQRIRPLLSMMAYRSYAEVIDEDIQKSLALIIECFHKASLIHDDIEDGDDYRYNQEVLHKTHGVPIALNVGDYLVGKGYHILSKLPVEDSLLAASLKIVSSSHLNLTVGQGADLMLSGQLNDTSVDDLLKIFVQKTGEAVKVALLIGAINGGADESEMNTLRAFSDWFGIAYQIRDDLNEFRENKPEELQHSPFLMVLLKEKLSENIKMNGNTRMEDLHQLIIDEKIDSHADAYLKLYVEKCYQELDQLQNLKLKLSLYGLMGKIFQIERT